MNKPKRRTETPGWFDKHQNIKLIQFGLFGGCVLLFLADIVLHLKGLKEHAYFKWEEWPLFYAAFGFVATTVLALGAKFILRPLVKRDEDLYDR